ncbi:hypothetical protein AS159_04210 [Thermotoga sp. Ku-13t]|uniref:hypothetical protein n=1 Tax=Thermotoga sp. Ku-13t TaxID=1755813 RepID=UPI0013ED073A|nr:hypothetical protein [Thermotoga sp. Ku-13t]KAF2958879.1 hypothetical protein AS159_04210 [Thermotoga sp. Ku-13t]
MRKLLVLLVALVTVAAFAAVSISGSAWAELSVEFDTSTGTATPTITSGGSVKLVLSGNTGEKTGFSVSFSGFGVSSAYVWEKIYTSDTFSVKYRLGTLSRGTTYVSNSGGAFALDFNIASGDLTDNLSVFVYFPGNTTLVDADVYNSLSFTFLSLKAFAKGVISAGAGSFPLIGLDATVDLAKALNIQNASLSGYACLGIDPNQTGMDMLPNYKFGMMFGIDKLSGEAYFEGPETIGASFETTVLSPVTLGAYVELPTTLTGFGDIALGAYATWTSELLSHKVSIDFAQPNATVAWTVSVSF